MSDSFLIIDPLQFAESFNYSAGPGFTRAVRYAYPIDLDGDQLEEVIFAGLESQCCTKSASDYTNTRIAIFGWEGVVFKDITHKWLNQGEENVMGVGDVSFGDFNGDNLTDIFMSGNADMDFELSSYQFLNKGNRLEKIDLGLTKYEHGAAAGDINLDGYDDVVVAAYTHPSPFYLGGPSGLKRYFVQTPSNQFNTYETFASGITMGHFFDKQQSTVIVSDGAVGNDQDDTRLLDVLLDRRNEILGFKFKKNLPLPRLLLPRYLDKVSDTLPSQDKSHDVRVKTIDFSNDQIDDVIVFSRAGHNGNIWPKISQVQFLKNSGSGSFQDVTDSILVDYPIDSEASYAPVFSDVNQDGLFDIFVGEPSDLGASNSASVLIQTADGKFIDTARSILSSKVPPGGTATVVRGPGGDFYLVVENQEFFGEALVYFSKISFPSRDLDENLVGRYGNENIFGKGGNDTIQGLAGDDWIDGGGGIDVAEYSGSRKEYSVTRHENLWNFNEQKYNSAGYFLADLNEERDGRDSLIAVERLQFSDSSLAFDTSGVAGQAYRIYKAAFDRTPDSGGLGYWIAQMDKGMGVVEVAARFIDSPEFRSLYGQNPSNADFLTKVYTNVLGRTPDQGGYDWWLNELNTNPDKTRQKVLADFAEIQENKESVAALVANGIQYAEFLES